MLKKVFIQQLSSLNESHFTKNAGLDDKSELSSLTTYQNCGIRINFQNYHRKYFSFIHLNEKKNQITTVFEVDLKFISFSILLF